MEITLFNMIPAEIRVKEAIKTGGQSQRLHRELYPKTITNREGRDSRLRIKILLFRCLFREYVDNLYCRTLGTVYSRSC